MKMISIIIKRSIVLDMGILVIRVMTGTLLIHHGYEKLDGIENFADAFVRPLHLPFPVTLSYIAAFSEIIGSWMLITGTLTRLGALAILGTMSFAVYHAVVTSGFNIYLLELICLYWSSSFMILCSGAGRYSGDEVIYRCVRALSSK